MNIQTQVNKQSHVGKFNFSITREYSDNTNKESFDAEVDVKYDCNDYPWVDIKPPFSFNVLVGDTKQLTVSKERVNDVDKNTWSETCGYATISLIGAPSFVTVKDEDIIIAPSIAGHAG
jgi:hypothetical protein